MVLSKVGQRCSKRNAVLYLCILALSCGVADRGWAQETAAYFKANCASCHTIGGGRLTGPDLKGVVERAQQAGKDRDWLITFIQDPQRMINSGDAYAARLVQDSRGVVMTKIVGMDAEKAGFLIDLIVAESLLEESQFKGAAISNEPFTPEDVERGLALFTGREDFNRGLTTMCMSCHRIPGVGLLGGGNLGPDLTRVYEKGKHTTGGRATLSAWLMAPATPTMQALLEDHPLEEDEVHALVALMKSRAAKSQPEPMGASMVSFAILGLLGAALSLFVFDSLWESRFRSARRTLVDDSKL